MSDDRALYLLHNLKSESAEITSTFPKLQPDFLKNVVQSLSSLVIDSNKFTSTNRMGYVQLIRRLCDNHDGHQSVNASNYETFIEVSNLATHQEDLDIYKFQKEIENEEFNRKERDIITEAAEFYTRRLQKHKNRVVRLAFLNTCNQKSFSDLDYTPSRKLENFTENIQMLRDLKVIKNTEDDPKADNCETLKFIEKRESDIKLGYASIHLNSTKKVTVIQNLLTDLQSRLPLKKFETEFLQFVCKMEGDFKEEVLNSFPYILEQPVIELAGKLLDSEYEHTGLKTDPQFIFVVECASLHPLYFDRITSIIHELYAFSNYNESVLALVFGILAAMDDLK